MRKRKNRLKSIQNRRAWHDYSLGDSFEAGLVLSGVETKSLRNGQGSLQGAYVTVKDGELWLVNALIAGASGVRLSESEQTRTRKLLAKKREINQLIEAKKQGNTIVPLQIMTAGRYIKLKLAIGRGKKLYDKRETLKKRDDMRRTQAIKKLR